MKRPALDKQISAADFENFYWLKAELTAFCHQFGLSTGGSKQEIAARISLYLRTGKIEASVPRKSPKTVVNQADEPPSLTTVITTNYRSSEAIRAFFKNIIGENFHFSVAFQRYFKENVGKTFADAVDYWYQLEAQRKDPNFQTEIAPQFEYNRFTRAYFADPANAGKKRQDAIEAWNKVKAEPGSNRYVPSTGDEVDT
jgi:hypothetical protein